MEGQAVRAVLLGSRPPQYTSTSTVACSTDFTTSSNLRSLVWASFSLAATSGTDASELQRKAMANEWGQANETGLLHSLVPIRLTASAHPPVRRRSCRAGGAR